MLHQCRVLTTWMISSQVCGVSCASLHGDKPQRMRSQVLEDFQNGSYQVLVSTSVLGRGIDLLNVVMVCIILLHIFPHHIFHLNNVLIYL